MANPSNVYIVGVEMVAIISLTAICIMGMVSENKEIAAAAVGGIAGFISHKSMTHAYGSAEDDSSTEDTPKTPPETSPKSKEEMAPEENSEDVA